MNTTGASRTSIALFFLVLSVSASTMLLLLWRFPISTGATIVLVLAALGLSARLSQPSDGDGIPDQTG